MKATGPSISLEAQRQDSTWRPATLVAALIVERSRLALQVEALRSENERLRQHRFCFKSLLPP